VRIAQPYFNLQQKGIKPVFSTAYNKKTPAESGRGFSFYL